MSTRAGSATASLRAKQNLVRLLFCNTTTQTKNGRIGSHNNIHRSSNPMGGVGLSSSLSASASASVSSFDSSMYSYFDLRTAYLQTIQQLHPDKYHSNSTNSMSHHPPIQSKSLFLQVQEAWKLYESFAKHSNQCSSSSATWKNSDPNDTTGTTTSSSSSTTMDANFTMFGVGCSFADNEQERQYRNYIMDQASRGYFTTGEIGYSNTNDNHNHKNNNSDNPAAAAAASTTTCSASGGCYRYSHQPTATTSNTNSINICPDDLFDATSSGTGSTTINSTASSSSSSFTSSNNVVSSSLVSHLIPPHRRRPT